jgi:hypothetical protein
LGRHPEVDTAVAVGHRQPGFGAERGLVLLADLVITLDDDVGVREGIAAPDKEVSQSLTAPQRLHGISQRFELFVLGPDRCAGCPRLLGMVSGDQRHRFARVADFLTDADQDRLVAMRFVEPEAAIGRQVGGGEHGPDSRHRERPRGVDRTQDGARMRAAQGFAEKHLGCHQVARELEAAGDLVGSVRPGHGLADAAPGPGLLVRGPRKIVRFFGVITHERAPGAAPRLASGRARALLRPRSVDGPRLRPNGR